MNTIIAYVRPDNTTSILCPVCKKSRQLTVKKFRDTSHSLTVRCECKAVFTIHLDFRLCYRKKIDLPGSWEITNSQEKEWGNMRIQTLSKTGVGFLIIGQHKIKKDQTLLLEFHLDDRGKTKIIKKIRICSIKKNYIGGAFVDQTLHEKELRFYLFP